jgi:hypothetical protein
VRLAHDALALGDADAAARCLEAAAKWCPRDLIDGGALTTPSLEPLRDRVRAAEVEEARSRKERDPLDWYAIAALCAMSPRAEAAAIRAFRRGAAGDPDATAKDTAALRETLRGALGEVGEALIALLRRDGSNDWRGLAGL